MASNYWKAMMIMENNRKRWLKVNPNLNENSGIYILTRVDENGIRYAYIGQAKHILTRLAQHLMQYQHIDLSLKHHKLFSDTKPYGWKVNFWECAESDMDEYERRFIKEYADKGYQLRNKTSGGQDSGKVGIDNNKAPKGYHDGLKQGYANCLKDIKEYFNKYLYAMPYRNSKTLKKDGTLNETCKRKIKEFYDLIK